MATTWLDRLKKRAEGGLDINKPVPTGEIKDLNAPLPDPAREKRQRNRWHWYNRKVRWRRWHTKERQA